MANSSPEEPSEARNSSPPAPVCSCAPADLPWLADETFRARHWGDDRARAARYGRATPCLNAAQLIRRRASGAVAHVWRFRGPSHLAERVESNAGVISRFPWEGMSLSAHRDRGGADSGEMLGAAKQPDRDRRLRADDPTRGTRDATGQHVSAPGRLHDRRGQSRASQKRW